MWIFAHWQLCFTYRYSHRTQRCSITVNLWQARLLLYSVYFTMLHALDCDWIPLLLGWLWMCAVRYFSSAFHETNSSKVTVIVSLRLMRNVPVTSEGVLICLHCLITQTWTCALTVNVHSGNSLTQEFSRMTISVLVIRNSCYPVKTLYNLYLVWIVACYQIVLVLKESPCLTSCHCSTHQPTPMK